MDNIVCMKWGTRFSADYVNKLAGMVQRHLKQPYRFVCFTENADGLHHDIDVRPLPEMHLPANWPERGWRKLTMFGETLFDLTGRALFLDLDIVILGDMAPFFELPGDFLIIRDWDFPGQMIGNSSVFRFDIGKHADVLENFIKNGEKIRVTYRNEQAYLSHAMNDKGILQYWPDSCCCSFKRHCLYPFPVCYFATPKKPDAKIVIFHGHPNPHEAIQGYVAKYGFRMIRPTKWVEENWRE